MLVSWRSITLPFKKTSEVEVCTWGSQLFWKFLSESCSTHGWCEGVWRAELENGWGDPSSWSSVMRSTLESCWQVSTSKRIQKVQLTRRAFRTCFFFQITEAYFRSDELGGKFSKEIHGSIPLHPMIPSFSVLHRVEVFQIWCILLGLGSRSGKSKASIMRILSPPRKLGA